MSSARTRLRYDAFVSHEQDCAAWAYGFILNLEELGLKVWHRGGSLNDGANDAIEASRAFLQIVSPGSFTSRAMSLEQNRALALVAGKATRGARAPAMKLWRVVISDYDYPDYRIQKLIDLRSYSVAEYQRDVTGLAARILDKVPHGALSKIPSPAQWPVEASIWNHALNIADFSARFSALWAEYEQGTRRQRRVADFGAERSEPEAGFGDAYRYLYLKKCHTSVQALHEVLNSLRDRIDAASGLVEFGRGGAGAPWWRDAFEEIDNAVARERSKQRDAAENSQIAAERAAEDCQRAEKASGRLRAEHVTEQGVRLEEEEVPEDRAQHGPPGIRRGEQGTLSSLAGPEALTAPEEEREPVLSQLSRSREGECMILKQDDIMKIYDAAVSAELVNSRDALLVGIDRRFTASLPTSPRPAEQLVLDLNNLNNAEPLADGSVPLQQWLLAAICLAGPRREVEIFENALAVTRSGVSARSSGAASGRAEDSQLLTWEKLTCAPPLYQVNAFDDVVVCMHPTAERDWRGAVRDADRQALTVFAIRTPDDAWHQNPPDASVWRSVMEQIDSVVKDVQARKPKRIHLVAKGPFSLGALLGARLDPQNHGLLVYQHDTKDGSQDQKVWRPWGPTWPADPGTRTEPFFHPPAGLDQSRPEEDGDVAVVVDLTGRSNTAECAAAVQARKSHRAVRHVHITARKTGQLAISVPADADKAASELEGLIQQTAEALPNATLHFFYYGPLAILIRASCRMGRRRSTLIVYEAVKLQGEWRPVPAMAFPQGKLRIGEGAP